MKVKPNGSNQTIVESSNGVEVLYSYETPVALQSPTGGCPPTPECMSLAKSWWWLAAIGRSQCAGKFSRFERA